MPTGTSNTHRGASEKGSTVKGSTVELLPPHKATSSIASVGIDVEADAKAKTSPRIRTLEGRYGFLSRLSFSYLNGLVAKAHKKMLMADDLEPLGDEDYCDQILERFTAVWEKDQVDRKKEGAPEKSGASTLLWAFYSMQPGDWWTTVVLELGTRGLLFLTPFLLDWTIIFLEGRGEQGTWYGVLLALCMGLCVAISGVLENRMQAILVRISFNMQASIMAQVYRKYFRLSPDSLAQTNFGTVLNMVGEDTQRIFQLMPIINFLWSAPLQMLTVAVLLLFLVGWAPTLGAVGVLVVILIVMRWSNDTTQRLEKERARLMDQRVKLLGELIQGMKAVKLYAWEDPMREAIRREREQELSRILRIYLLRALNVALFSMAPVLMSVAIFFIYVSQGRDLDPATVFGTIALVGLVRAPLIILPILQTAYNSGWVSFNRIYKYLTLPEKEASTYLSSPGAKELVSIDGAFAYPANSAYETAKKGDEKDGAADTKGEDKKSTNENEESKHSSSAGSEEKKQALIEQGKSFSAKYNISVGRGELLQIVGPVGAGKSSIFLALLGNMNDKEGEKGKKNRRRVQGTVAYVPQHPWVMNRTLRDNVLFGHPYDAEKYRRVIWLCALGPDLRQLPNGDQTMIGEQGINLSGGQKQRVALARAIYADADVYLLDDPLSAVDQHVAAHIFFCTIQHHLRSKAVVLATHQVQFLKYATRVVVLKEGQQVANGTYEALREEHLSSYPQVDKKTWLANGHSIEMPPEEEKKEAEKEKSTLTIGDVAVEVAGKDGKAEDDTKMEKKEAKQSAPPAYKAQSGMPMSVHLTYFRSAGPLWAIFLLFVFFVLTQLAIMASDYWLAAWTGDFFNQGRTFYMIGYGVIALIGGVIAFSRIIAYALAAKRASERIHEGSVDTMMDATMRHFDQTPMGAITALFARDQSMIDTFLPELYNANVTLIVMLLVSLLVVAIILPWLFLVFIPVLYLAWRVQQYSLPCVGNAQILNMMSLGPVFSFFQESMSGSAVIRASGRLSHCEREVFDRIDVLNNSYYHAQLTTKWVDVRMDLVSGFIIFMCALLVVVTRGTLNIELASLILAYTLGVAAILGFIVQIRAYMEMMLTAVQRCDAYKQNTPKERFTGAVQVGPQWPAEPTVEFEGVSFRYGDATDKKGPLVLSGLTFEIPKGKKIAVIGRTGAGKSSLTAALLRVNELESGRVRIGGDSLADIPIRKLRGRVAVIPQDPVLFTGSIRFNLDPFKIASDEEVWRTLESVQLAKVVHDQPGGAGLNSPVRENGSNFSIGQRQLFCVARALLVKSKVLIMDEATASVDYVTDAKIQKVLREEFAECTILTIAHRIQTILDYDLILALEKGKVAEFGKPGELLKDKESYFSQLLTEEQKEERKKQDDKEEKENHKSI
eukprot:CAMPEP_0114497420 /NCGR_PEP_ID=MMETSP0109-20121206/6317_1 /TAXON_ID=29199 /ORGANISM="Chlorarachnion reptans, Strain CCCM449" /LENGTH=1397 /DNA_ID=CAMNT_0001674805 /DNA_START=146 /DNA_END=4339 /DNA_ORIENTATION=+